MPDVKIDVNCLFEVERRLNAYLNSNELEQLENQHAEKLLRVRTADRFACEEKKEILERFLSSVALIWRVLEKISSSVRTTVAEVIFFKKENAIFFKNRFPKQFSLSPVPYSYGLEISVNGVQPLKSFSSPTHRFLFKDLIDRSSLVVKNPTAPSPLGQIPPNDGMPGGPMAPAGFFPNSHMRPSPPQQPVSQPSPHPQPPPPHSQMLPNQVRLK
ncbi:uncharacterized protein TNCV_2377021 [Trichonephila clavipes]|nr:uncharacterized protein TNCV_2377021 [Trichonephila clavipes]